MKRFSEFLKWQVRKTAVSLLIANFFILAIISLVAYANRQYIVNLFSGPLELSKIELDAIRNPQLENRNYATVRGDKSFPTGLQEVVQKKNKNSGAITSETVTHEYTVVLFDKRLLIVKAPNGTQTSTTFTGELVGIPWNLQQKIVNDKSGGDYSAAFYPFMLDASDYTNSGYVWLAIGVPLFIYCFFKLLSAIKWLNSPQSHPAVSKYQNSLSSQEEDIAESESIQKFGSEIVISKHWVLKKEVFSFTLFALTSFTWAYKKVVQKRVYGVPSGKDYGVIIHNEFGGSIESQMNEIKTNELLTHLQQNAPWIVIGYSDDLSKLWTQNRKEFLAAVQQRKMDARSEIPGTEDAA